VLAPQPHLGDDRAVPLDVVLPDVVQEAAALADQHQQAAPAVVVLLVLLQMLVEVVDPLGEDRDLDLGRAGVGVVGRCSAMIPALALSICSDMWGGAP
jgi:hypothetical protein